MGASIAALVAAALAAAPAGAALPQQSGSVDLQSQAQVAFYGASGKFTTDQPDRTGISVAPAGDVNGDGFGDVVI